MGKCLSVAAEVAQEINDADQNNGMIEVSNVPNLADVNIDEVSNVPYKDEIIEMRITKVYDGDTIHCIVLFGTKPVKISIRMLGIDTPEIKRGKDRLDEERVAGLICRERLKVLVKNGAKLRIRDWDKYGGRMLGDVILDDGTSAVEAMIKEGYGREYNGEKKENWTKEQLTSSPFDVNPRDLNMTDLDEYDTESD